MDNTYLIVLGVIIAILFIIVIISIYLYRKKKREANEAQKDKKNAQDGKMMAEIEVVDVKKKLEIKTTGTNIHQGITKFINEGIEVAFLTKELTNTFRAFLKWREEHNSINETCDIIVKYKKELKRIDYVCEIQGIKYLIDFKTEKLEGEVKPLTSLKWLIQLLSYERALSMPDKDSGKAMKVDKLAILHLNDKGYRFYVWEDKLNKEEIEKSILDFNDLKIDVFSTPFKKKVREGFLKEEVILSIN